MRDIIKVSNKIIDVIKEKCSFEESKKEEIIKKIEHIQNGALYKAPELMYMCWYDLADVLNSNFNADKSEWENEIKKIFNNEVD